MHTVLICENPLCGALTINSDTKHCVCGGAFRSIADAGIDVTPAESAEDDITTHGIEAYRLAWLKRLEPYWPVAVFIGPTGAGKSSLINLALGWPALWGRSGSHTTRCPAILTRHDKRIVSCGNESAGMEYFCEPGGETHPGMLSFRNISKRLEFISECKISGDVRDKFWRSFEEQFADWRQTGITGDVYVKVSTPLSGIPDGTAIVDVPGFDGAPQESDSDRYRLERDLAAATDFWSETADVAVFVFELEGLNRAGDAARLERRLRQNKPTAVFFNKLDRLDLWQHGLEDDNPENIRKTWAQYKEERLRKLQEEGLTGCRVFFGFSAFDAKKKAPSEALAREWSRGTAHLFDWMRRSLRAIRNRTGKRPADHPVSAWRDNAARAVLESKSEERKALEKCTRDCLAEWATYFPDDVRVGDISELSLLDCRNELAKAKEHMCDNVLKTNRIFRDEVEKSPVRKALLDIRFREGDFAPSTLQAAFSVTDRDSSEYKTAQETYSRLVKFGKSTSTLLGSLSSLFFSAKAALEAQKTLLSQMRSDLQAYLKHEFRPVIQGMEFYEPEVRAIFDIDPIEPEKFLKHLAIHAASPAETGFDVFTKEYKKTVSMRLWNLIAQSKEDYKTGTRNKEQLSRARKLREETNALFSEAQALTERETARAVGFLKKLCDIF